MIGDVGAESSVDRPRGQRKLPIASLRPNARNPRRMFAETELDELAASLRERGIIQPIVARPVRGTDDFYEIIAGERRWRAAQRAGLHEVPVVIVEATDGEALQLAIIENVQRSDLNPLEEAEGYRALMEEFGNSHDEIAKFIGKSRSHVANMLPLRSFRKRSSPISIAASFPQVMRGCRSVNQMPTNWPTKLLLAGSMCARSKPSQHETTARLSNKQQNESRVWSGMPATRRPQSTLALEKRIADALGLAVEIEHGERGGTVTSTPYRSLDQLDHVVRRLEAKH